MFLQYGACQMHMPSVPRLHTAGKIVPFGQDGCA
jgi:hypothetical protein